MIWKVSHRADPPAVALADLHYNRQKPGTAQFVPPGRCVVLLSVNDDAVWTTSWPFAEYVKHQWAGAWINSLFRNEGAGLSSQLIREAIAATRYFWEPPELGMITFVNANKIKSTNPGYCYIKAGFRKVGYTQGGLVVLQLLPNEMPGPIPPINTQLKLELTGSLFVSPPGELL